MTNRVRQVLNGVAASILANRARQALDGVVALMKQGTTVAWKEDTVMVCGAGRLFELLPAATIEVAQGDLFVTQANRYPMVLTCRLQPSERDRPYETTVGGDDAVEIWNLLQASLEAPKNAALDHVLIR